jgi:hypothetical protein
LQPWYAFGDQPALLRHISGVTKRYRRQIDAVGHDGPDRVDEIDIKLAEGHAGAKPEDGELQRKGTGWHANGSPALHHGYQIGGQLRREDAEVNVIMLVADQLSTRPLHSSLIVDVVSD